MEAIRVSEADQTMMAAMKEMTKEMRKEDTLSFTKTDFIRVSNQRIVHWNVVIGCLSGFKLLNNKFKS